MSQLTTHILDTTKGKPAAGITVILYKSEDADENWKLLATAVTDSDGRVKDLLQQRELLEIGDYKLRFETKPYFEQAGIEAFYPFIEIAFTISTTEHYHVPLLLNPFGYSTYRGS